MRARHDALPIARYRATGLVRALAQGFQGSGRLATAARPHILDLTRRIGWPVSITTRIGPDMVVEVSTHDHTTMAFSSPDPGYSLPILECAAGLDRKSTRLNSSHSCPTRM